MRAKVGQNVHGLAGSTVHMYTRVYSVYGRDKLRKIIILKRRWKELGSQINNYTYPMLLKFLIYSDKRG